MFEAKTNTIFDAANEIRAAWVNQVRDTIVDVKLKSYPRELRFELYTEFDSDVRNEYIRLLQERAVQMKEAGNYSERSVAGRRILKKEHQIDTDHFLYQAVNNVVERVSDEIKFHQDPEPIIA